MKKALTIPDNIRVRATVDGWQTREEHHHWLPSVFGRESHWRLLIVDKYRPHCSDERVSIAREKCNSEVIFIPCGCTSLAQPMDNCVNK